MLRTLDLFSGIGGFSLGLERTGGFETVAFCEANEYARKVLRKHWPDVPIFEQVEGLDFGSVDVVCGGFPCQPVSVAGERGGEEDDRWLWPEMYRIVATSRPRWVLIENVTGLIRMGLDTVLSDLERGGYATGTFVLPAIAAHAPQKRSRVWIVAHADADRFQVERAVTGAVWWEPGHDPLRRCSDDGRTWATEPDVGRVAHGVPSRLDRLRCLGNSVVPAIVERIGHAILEAENVVQ